MRLVASPFDSQHYDLNVGRLVSKPADGASELAAALADARQRALDVLFLRLVEGDRLCDVLAADGHLPIDTLVISTLQRRDARPDANHATVAISHHDRLDDPQDIAAIAAITSESMRTSHLHADARLPVERTHALYAAWARNDVTGRAQRTIVARAGREIVGYITLLVDAASVVIDLVAVRPSWHGRGVGSAMIASVVGWVADRDVVTTVGTQTDNPALALYARSGFVPTEKHVTYHLWLTEAPR